MWKHGEKAELARRAGISPPHLCNILGRRTRAGAALAHRLESACYGMGIRISKEDWAFSVETDNEYFKTKP